MKKILLLLVTMLTASLAAQADVAINATNFPDANFRSYLTSQYPVGYITTAQLNACTELSLDSKGVANAKGIEYFTQLTRLDLYNNSLSTVDVSQNTKLTYLNLGLNQLTSINVSQNTLLEELYLQNNQLTTITVTNHSSLETLWVQKNYNLTTLNCQSNNLTNLCVSNCTALQTLKCYYNDYLTTIQGLADCTAITYLDCEDCSISDLSAVSGMNNLQTLLARYNQLTSLNVSNKRNLTKLRVSYNTRLTDLRCYSCALTSLNVTGCTALTGLRCYYNYDLTEIMGLATCTALTYLDCEDCAITDLPGVNNMNNLQTLWCRNNQLTQLQVNEKSQLKYLRVSGNTGLTYLSCDHCALTSLDVTNCTALEDFDCSDNASLTTITGLATCTALINFSAEYCALNTSLDMSFCPGLQTLYCYHNNLTGLDVTGLSELLVMNCKQNAGLTEITGLADCSQVTYLECSECALTSLDVSNMSALQELWCTDNQFTILSVELKPYLTTLIASNNPLLEELECYECALTRLEIYNCPVLNYLDCEYNQLSNLNTYSCPALKYLLCNSNNLTQLNIENNNQLTYVWCNSNQLTSLDVSHCSEDLRSLDCRNNQITGTIDVSRFAELFQLACSNNEITQLTLGNHPILQNIWCQENHLTELDVDHLPALQSLYCYRNYLTGIDVSGCTALQILYTNSCRISSLNVTDCPALTDILIYYNRVQANKMGEMVDELPVRSDDDWGYIYALVEEDPENGYVDGNVITASQVNQANAKYWKFMHFDWDEDSWLPYAGAFLRGDVDGDGEVNIADVTLLINMVLTGNVTGNPVEDVDGNGEVNIGDVTVLISYVLNGAWPDEGKAAVTSAKPHDIPNPIAMADAKLELIKKPRISNK